jgi:replicative DNA helicase
MMIYREDYYDEFTERKWVTDIFIRKNRNGPTGSVQLMFQKNNQKFVEIEKNLQPNEY